MDPLLLLSGSQLAQRIRRKEISSLEAVETHIRRVQQVNPTLNAVVQDRFALAREEARQADRVLGTTAPDTLPPFWGVPCTIKESFALAGMPNTSGLVARRGVVAGEDAPAVARLRAAGAIPIGVTNISELCMWMESHNYVYGRTRNPYDPRRTSGGSSGGEGAIIGAGASPFGLGSDVGGSIRMPAFFGGVFGHKPSSGMVPNTGQFPSGEGDLLRYVVTGPLCRRAEDLMPLLRILAGPDGQDTVCRPFALGDPGAVELDRLVVLDVPDNGAVRVSRDLVQAQRRCAAALAGRGATVIPTRIPLLKRSLTIWSAMLSAAGGPSFAELLGQGTPINAALHLLLWPLGRSPHTLPAIGLALLEKIPHLVPAHAARALDEGRTLQQELNQRLGSDGVMLFPSHGKVAPPHARPLLPPFSWTYTSILNVMELPVTQVPLGLNRQGLPVGIQVVAAHGNDHLTIAVALELERIFGGWVPPTRPD